MRKRKPIPRRPLLGAACKRCGMPLKVDPKAGSKAQMLKRAKTAEGYCICCAVHDWLRNTHPPNVLLAESGPGALANPHVRAQFEAIMRAGSADAMPEEINWNRIIEFWDLPFDTPVKPSPTNPVHQSDLDKIASGECRAFGFCQKGREEPDPLGGNMTITSFEQLNQLDPGAGDELKACLDEALGKDRSMTDGKKTDKDEMERTEPMIADEMAQKIFNARAAVKDREADLEEAKLGAKECRENLDNAQMGLNALIDQAKSDFGPLFERQVGEAAPGPEAWRGLRLDDPEYFGQLPAGLLKKLAEGEPAVVTLGDFQRLHERDGDRWHFPYKGIGHAAKQKLEDAIARLWEQHPEFTAAEAAQGDGGDAEPAENPTTGPLPENTSDDSAENGGEGSDAESSAPGEAPEPSETS